MEGILRRANIWIRAAATLAVPAVLLLLVPLADAEAHTPAECARLAVAPTGQPALRRAIKACSSALERTDLDDGQRAEVLRLRGSALREAGDLHRSLSDLTQAKQLRPKDPLIARALTLTLHAMGRTAEAEREIERALLIEPHLQGFLTRCMILLDTDRYADGITDCEAVHQVDPSEESAFLTARLYVRLGREAAAVTLLETAIGTRNGSPRVRSLLADIRAKTGKARTRSKDK